MQQFWTNSSSTTIIIRQTVQRNWTTTATTIEFKKPTNISPHLFCIAGQRKDDHDDVDDEICQNRNQATLPITSEIIATVTSASTTYSVSKYQRATIGNGKQLLIPLYIHNIGKKQNYKIKPQTATSVCKPVCLQWACVSSNEVSNK